MKDVFDDGREVVAVESHLIEDARFHERYMRGARRRQLASEAIDALSLGIVPLYRAAKREWLSDPTMDLHMGVPVQPTAFQATVRALKRGVQALSGYIDRDGARPDRVSPGSADVSSRSADASLESIAGSAQLEPPVSSYDPAAIGAAYVSETLGGRTLNPGAMRAVVAKRSRLETFARTYAQTGSIGEAVVAVGITSERTIDDYVRRAGISNADRTGGSPALARDGFRSETEANTTNK